jgi:hypothetical protein
MKPKFLFLIVLIAIQAALIGQPDQSDRNSVNYEPDSIEQLKAADPLARPSGEIDLQKQFNELEKRLISFESNREYTSDILSILGLIFMLIIGFSSYLGFYFIPKRQKENYENFAAGFEERFSKLQEKISKADINANRAHYAMKSEQAHHMTVVWCGRWIEAIYSAGSDINDTRLKKDILTILRRTKKILFSHPEEELIHLKRFSSKGGVIDNFQKIAHHDDKDIKIVATDILQFLLKLWYGEK